MSTPVRFKDKLAEIYQLRSDASHHLIIKKIPSAIEALKTALQQEKQLLGHEHPQFLHSADALVGLFDCLKMYDESASLMLWSLHPAGLEPYSIYDLAAGKDDGIDHIWNVIQAELESSGSSDYLN